MIKNESNGHWKIFDAFEAAHRTTVLTRLKRKEETVP